MYLGLVDDPRTMLNNINSLLTMMLEKSNPTLPPVQPSPTDEEDIPLQSNAHQKIN